MKSIILLNNRSLNLYDFKEIKDNYDLKISAIVFKNYYESLPNSLKKNLEETLDALHIFPEPVSTQKFLSFSEDFLCHFLKKEFHKSRNMWVVTTDELSVLNVATAREKYDLSGPSKEIILNYKDKAIQKELLSKTNLRIPQFVPIHNSGQKNEMHTVYKQTSQKLKIPFILKPANMGGAIGVECIQNYNDFCNYFIKFSYFSHLIAEEFIDGQLYHCDFIIYKGQYIVAEVAQYLYNGGLAFIKGYNHGSLLLQTNDRLREAIIEFCKKANSLLGLKSGCAHFEVFVTKDQEIIFLEAAGRPAGSGVPIVLTKVLKKNYMNAALLAEIEENPGTFNNPSEYCFWACFPKKLGTVKELNVPSFHSSYELEWYVRKGEFLSSPSLSVVEKAGMLLANNRDYEVLKSDFYSLKNFNAIEFE